MIGFQTTFLEQLFDITQRKRVPKIPADCTEDQLRLGLPPFEDRRPRRHLGIFKLPVPLNMKVATQPNAVERQGRTHLYAVAAKMMRRVLVNQAIARSRRKRGGSAILFSLTAAGDVSHRTTDVAALDEALIALAKLDARKSELVELRFFGGLTAEETAEVLGISVRTVRREWDLARAWLFRELRGSE